MVKQRVSFFSLFIPPYNTAEAKARNIMYIAAIGIFLSLLHYITAEYMTEGWYIFHLLLRRLYFVPVLLAAIYSGKHGATIVAGLVTITFLPHLFLHWPKTLITQSENITELVMLWIVGISTGYLSDKLKRSYIDRTRYATIKHMTSAFSLVSDDMLIDYKACMGLTKALSDQTDKDSNHALTINVLSTRLEHLGHHIENVCKIIGSKKTVKKRKNLVKTIQKGIDNIPENDAAQFKVIQKNKVPHLFMDEERMVFALACFLQSMVQEKTARPGIRIIVIKKHSFVHLQISSTDKSALNVAEQSNNESTNKEHDYNWTLAAAIIRMHGGEIETVARNGSITSLNIIFPVQEYNEKL